MKSRDEGNWPCARHLNRNGLRHFGLGGLGARGGMNSSAVAVGAPALPSRIGGRGKPHPYRGSGVSGEGVGGLQTRVARLQMRGRVGRERGSPHCSSQ